MRLLKSGVIVLLVTLGLFAGPAHAFGPMMLLVLPMMMGGQHAMGNSHGSGEENKTHGSTASHAEQRHPATVGEQPIPSTGQSESPQAGSEAESVPASRENTQ